MKRAKEGETRRLRMTEAEEENERRGRNKGNEREILLQ